MGKAVTEDNYYNALADSYMEAEEDKAARLADEVLGEPMDEIEEALDKLGLKICDPPY